jgi:pimeloyl-ACP methyl ester carboxylesterase
MKGEIVRVITQDGLYLEGMWCEPAAPSHDTALVHCHGFGGSFYSQPFLDFVADDVTARGYTFFSFNTRGHDSLSVLFRQTPERRGEAVYGATIEQFEECLIDFKTWLDFVEARGFKRVALEGHSAGSIKSAYYQAQTQDKRVKTVMLLSPPDILGLFKATSEGGWMHQVEAAERMVAEGRGTELMPAGAFQYPIGARAFLSYARPGSPAFVFPFHDPHAPFETVGALRQPLLGVIGTVDEPVVGDPGECMALLKAKAANAPYCRTAVIEGADHSYDGREEKLAVTIGDWMDRVFGSQ